MIDHGLLRPSRIIIRDAAVTWLRAHADVAVRLVVAPPGFGKTTALRAYATGAAQRRRLTLDVDARTTRESFAEQLAQAVAAAPVEIVLDDAHLAAPDVIALLNESIATAPRDVYFVIAAARRDIFDVGALFVRGRIAVCDQSQLAFDAGDAAALFVAHGLDPDPDDMDRLVARCDGWPPAIVGTACEFARDAQPVDAAYERWRRARTVPAIDLLSALLERAPAAERTTMRGYFAGHGTLDQHTLAVLHRCGFFVRFDGEAFTLMRWIDELYAQRTGDGRPALEIQLFGRFTATLGGVPIVWARRRDQHIVKYLLLARDHCATRAELADVFWPHTARPLAMQNLRTACSTIRRAIGNVAGMGNVDGYLIAGERLVLNAAAIACDVDQFRRHVALADADDAAGAAGNAVAHLRAAERLYGNGLFAGDVSEPAFAKDAAVLAATYARVLARLSDAFIERGAPDLAREYAVKALKHNRFPASPAGSQIDLRFAAS